MKITRILVSLIVSSICFSSCTKADIEPTEIKNVDVGNYIWKAMNQYYLYKELTPELADDHFASETERNSYIKSFGTPEKLFYEGLVASPEDQYSYITDDYVALEKSFQGISTTTGMNYGLKYINNLESADVYGIVRYVLPGTSAEEMGLERGDIFTKVDGEQLTYYNYDQLLARNSFTIHLADADFVDTGEQIALTKTEYTENPVYMAKIIETEGGKVGYLMYNSFDGPFDDELNLAFAYFKAENISDLVLDLRYNGGGEVESAIDLASMITGQFKGEVLIKREYNEDIQKIIMDQDPEILVDRFNDTINGGEFINSLNLGEVYVIATGSSASASELVMNGLESHIDVYHIGMETEGKYQASATFYDSYNFLKANANPNHTYVILPLIFKYSNQDGKTGFDEGLLPDFKVNESKEFMGILGDPSEPLLATALRAISGTQQPNNTKSAFEEKTHPWISESGATGPTYQRMFEKDPKINLTDLQDL